VFGSQGLLVPVLPGAVPHDLDLVLRERMAWDSGIGWRRPSGGHPADQLAPVGSAAFPPGTLMDELLHDPAGQIRGGEELAGC
jgi:hypothetical protein